MKLPERFESIRTLLLNGADLGAAAAGEVPTAQGDGTLAMRAPPSGGSGAVTLVNTFTPAAVPEAAITGMDGTFSRYVIRGWLRGADNEEDVGMQFSNDGGSTWIATEDYGNAIRAMRTADSGQNFGSEGIDHMRLNEATAVGNGVGQGLEFTLNIYNAPNTSQYTRIYLLATYTMSNDTGVQVAGMGQYTVAEAVDALRIYFFTDAQGETNVAEGEVALYGL